MTTSFIKMARAGYVSISWARFLEWESANLALLLFLVKLTPAMPNLVEKRRRNQLWPYLWLGKTFLHVFFGRFWVSSTFWSHWSRFQSHWRSFAGDFASGKLSGPPGPFQCWSCWRLGASIFGDSKA
jgi:hypothetical protein